VTVPAAAAASPPHPVSQYVLKVHGRCDLACDHCYVFEHADQSWRRKARAMSTPVLQAAGRRIAEHARRWRLPTVRVVIHGGEPLLVGVDGLRRILEDLRTEIAPVSTLLLRMQTNGVLLTEDFCDLLVEFGVKVGVSLDGDRAANDRHRRFANGNGSYDQVVRALTLLRRPAYRSIYAGILCTIDVANDPVAVYGELRRHHPPRIDFLLPHATWEEPPPRPAGAATAYGDWLGAIHAQWVADGEPVRVRIFDSLRSAAAGGPTGSEQVGGGAADLLVVETDGTWEQADSLKTAFDGAPETGMSVFTHAVDDVSALPQIAGRQLGLAGLSATCRACPVVGTCGGGLYAHRYSHARGFDNPSVYCADLKELIHTMNGLTSTVAPGQADQGAAQRRTIIDQIGFGLGDEHVIAALVQAQLGITRALLIAVADGIDRHPYAGHGWRLLKDAERRAPAAAAEVIGHPYVRAWAVDRLQGGIGADDRGHLSVLAAVAAIRGGLDAEVPVPVRAGRIYLPGLGTALLPPGAGDVADVAITGGGFTVRAAGAALTVADPAVPGPSWRPARHLTGETTLLLEDADPYRDRRDWPTSAPLDQAQADRWQSDITQAWQIIHADAPDHLPALRAGLRAIVPLEADPTGRTHAYTSRHAFGAVAAAPASPPKLAEMLVHEFQHGKLGALLDLYQLYDPRSEVKLTVGWRPDPRPVEAALQGTYAHLSVARIWHVRAHRDGGAEAHATFRQYHDWTDDAIEQLRDSRALTPDGQRFVDRMAAALAGEPS
jgi:uncharacterized protein